MRKVGRRETAGLAILLLVSLPADAASQSPDVPSRDRFWVSGGLGGGSEGWGVSANVAFQHRSHLFSLRWAATTGFDDAVSDVALLYGYATPTSSRNHAGAAIGIAIVEPCFDSDGLFSSCIEQRTVLGLPIEAQLAWLPAKSLGIGLYGFGNINRIRSFGGVTLSLQFGRVR